MHVVDGEQEQLFGAPAGKVRQAILTITPPLHGQLGSVSLFCTTEMRKQPMGLLVQSIPADSMATAVGYMIPLALQAHYVGADRLKQHYWRVFRQFGIAGWEAAIQGCGKP